MIINCNLLFFSLHFSVLHSLSTLFFLFLPFSSMISELSYLSYLCYPWHIHIRETNVLASRIYVSLYLNSTHCSSIEASGASLQINWTNDWCLSRRSELKQPFLILSKHLLCWMHITDCLWDDMWLDFWFCSFFFLFSFTFFLRQYLELRFNKTVRICGTATFIFQMVSLFICESL